ncbi:MAG TPA: type II toxin-antitoxin system VapC family toxin [Gammaproteobacteria bacterium]|nr:type II toxin-antitoxin system VapC family toxin [Gammaproteobacteria bacterium]
MILLDTNIISEMMKSNPAPEVITWLNAQQKGKLFISTITIAEITYGLQILPEGKRRNTLLNAFQKMITELFKYRMLTFDEHAAYLYGELMGLRKTLGKPLSVPDGQIAAIASLHNATLATRNIRDFKDCNLKLINPFEL